MSQERNKTDGLAASLSHSEAKLYIHLLLVQGEECDDVALMRGARITDRRTYKAALGGLIEKRLYDEHAHRAVLPVMVTADTEPLHASHVMVTSSDVMITDIKQQAWEADEMPDGGALHDRHSPAAARRRAQAAALQAAWAALFPGDIMFTPRTAHAALHTTGGVAMDVLAEVVAVWHICDMRAGEGKPIKHPRSYLLKVLQQYAQLAPVDAPPPPPPPPTLYEEVARQAVTQLMALARGAPPLA